jgi:hypothetical protein
MFQGITSTITSFLGDKVEKKLLVVPSLNSTYSWAVIASPRRGRRDPENHKKGWIAPSLTLLAMTSRRKGRATFSHLLAIMRKS